MKPHQPAFERRKTARGAAYFETGQGEPLVLVHGVGLRLDAWAPQISALGGVCRVLAVDMPGHGASAPLPADSALPAFAAWLGEVLDDLGLDRVNLAGHSMGALVGAGAAAAFPQRIRRLALLNGVHRRDGAAKAAILARAAAIGETGVDVDGPVQRWFLDDPSNAGARALARDWLEAMDRDAYATAYRAFADGDAVYADIWPRTRCPVLFLTGGDDPNSTAAMARDMADLAPAGYTRIIQGHRHMVNMTAPDAVNRALLEWLAQPEAGA